MTTKIFSTITRYMSFNKGLVWLIISGYIIFGNNIPAKARVSDTDTILAKDTVADNIADSVYRLLPEVDVSAARSFHTAGMSVYTPTKREKNVATDATHLLQQMHITQLKLNSDGSLVAASGRQISYFIDGHPAQENNLDGMNTRDVMKVCVMENPSDPKYMGKEFVVDFIMQKYEYGGYTKLYESAYALGMWLLSERLSSRFTYKRMTFDLYASAYNTSHHKFTTKSKETFHLADGVSDRYRNPVNSRFHNDQYPVKFRAEYSHGTTYISNQIGYQYYSAPRYNSRGEITLSSGSVPDNYDFTIDRPNKNHTATWDGYMSLIFDRGWSLSASGYAYFTHYDSDYKYTTTEPVIISREITENSTESRLNAIVAKQINSSNSINIDIMGQILSSHSRYNDGRDSRSDFFFPMLTGKISFTHFTDKIFLTAYAGVAAEWNRINGNSINTAYPYGVVNLRYSPNSKNTLSFWTQYSTYSPTADSKNPTLIQQNELFFMCGNPELKTYPKFELNSSYTWSPTNKFDLTAMLMYTHFHNKISNTYTLTDGGVAVLQGYCNRGNTNVVYAMVSGAVSLLDGRLRISATPFITLYRGHKIDMPNLNAFSFQGDASYNMGSFYIGAKVNINNRSYNDYEMNRLIKSKPEYSFYAGWGNSHWSAYVSVKEIFRRSWDNWTSAIYSPIYDSETTQVSTRLRQNIYITLTYTFGYGKKIRRGNELGGNVSKSQSTILQ